MTELDEGSLLKRSKQANSNDNQDYWHPERIAA